MMDILDLIRSRRSIRKYKKDIPSQEQINQILEAGRWAPSGLNNQPWRFTLIQDRKVRDGLARFSEYGYIIKGAPIVICVFLDYDSSYNREKDIMAIGASLQNMLLCAHRLGLGGCWLGEILNKKDEVRNFLGIDRDFELMAVVTLGYPNEKISRGRRKGLSELIIK